MQQSVNQYTYETNSNNNTDNNFDLKCAGYGRKHAPYLTNY